MVSFDAAVEPMDGHDTSRLAVVGHFQEYNDNDCSSQSLDITQTTLQQFFFLFSLNIYHHINHFNIQRQIFPARYHRSQSNTCSLINLVEMPLKYTHHPGVTMGECARRINQNVLSSFGLTILLFVTFQSIIAPAVITELDTIKDVGFTPAGKTLDHQNSPLPIGNSETLEEPRELYGLHRNP